MYTPGPAYALYRLAIALAIHLWSRLCKRNQRRLIGLVAVTVVCLCLLLAGIDIRPIKQTVVILSSFMAIWEGLARTDDDEK